MTDAARTRLPDRRAAETFTVEFAGRRFDVSIGTDAAGAVAEIFLKGGHSGSELDIMLGDLGVAVSIALQYGAPPDVLARAFLRNEDTTPAGIAAAAMDRATAMEAERAEREEV